MNIDSMFGLFHEFCICSFNRSIARRPMELFTVGLSGKCLYIAHNFQLP
jgi:hypothetical protein